MIRWLNLLQVLGFFILALAAPLAAAFSLSFLNQDEGRVPLGLATAVALVGGLFLSLALRPERHEFNLRESTLLVVLSWMAAAGLGALPFYFSPYFPSFTDSFFESMSGFTTTGATVLAQIESLPDSLHFWRCLTHWLGGMGIILLGVAILPLIGAGGMELYRAEFSGASAEKLKPRIAETAKALWRIYVAFSLAEYVALRLVGMDRLDAVCHTFSTMGTGGFSTRAASIESFQSPQIEMVITVFMILAGVNFTQHYRLFVERRPKAFLGDLEIRSYLLLILLGTLALVINVYYPPKWLDWTGLRQSLFQVVSILTTTGFTSTNFEAWPPFAQLLLLALMFCGGCTGSTAGGLKTARIALLMRVVGREFRRMVERRGVFAIRLSQDAVSESTVQSLLNLVYLAFLLNFGASMLLTAMGVDVLTAISAVAATMFNIGPGLGQVGPAEHYGHLPAMAKWTLSFCMLSGRLEYYTLLVLLTRAFWRK